MNLNSTALANAAAATAAVLWVACSLLVVLLPGAMMSFTGHMIHLDLQTHAWTMNGTGFVYGLLLWVVAAWVTGWLIAVFYNRFSTQG